jgi:hypothetical protein
MFDPYMFLVQFTLGSNIIQILFSGTIFRKLLDKKKYPTFQ